MREGSLYYATIVESKAIKVLVTCFSCSMPGFTAVACID